MDACRILSTVIPGPPQAEPGIQLLLCSPKDWIPGSVLRTAPE
jgi:hypothetical protein